MEHATLPRALLAPRCYPHAVDAIQLVETHISWVLLTGEFVYKIKKPVKLSFLDFSTLALRKHFCGEELRLNRRFAPELYLDVVTIVDSKSGPRIGGEGPIIDYAVKLRQFDAQSELGQLLAARQVDCDELAQFGASLAQQHAASPPARDVSPATLYKIVNDNRDELTAIMPAAAARLCHLKERLQALCDARAAMFAERYASGVVRECHGDLHVGNIVRIDGQLRAFDCIEFDAALRNIDVLNDAAFLMMDLAAHAHRELAYCFVNAWLTESGDYLGLPLLPYYLIYRALVRAKVAALRANAADAARYLDEAQRRAQPKRAKLILTCGLSGSGKTWLSKALAPRIPAIHMRSDIERKRLAGLGALESSRSAPGGGIYSTEFGARTYQRLQDCARACLQAGETALIDAAFLRRAERSAFAALAQDCSASFAILHCAAPIETLRERIQQRVQAGRDASEATLAVLERQFDYWEPFAPEERASVIEVDTRRDAPDALLLQLQ